MVLAIVLFIPSSFSRDGSKGLLGELERTDGSDETSRVANRHRSLRQLNQEDYLGIEKNSLFSVSVLHALRSPKGALDLRNTRRTI